MIYVVLALIGVLSGMISGIVGTGSSIILLPILAYILGLNWQYQSWQLLRLWEIFHV